MSETVAVERAYRRALQRQGARLAAERNDAFDYLEFAHDEIAELRAYAKRLLQDRDSLELQLELCRSSRHRLVMKLKAEREAAPSKQEPTR